MTDQTSVVTQAPRTAPDFIHELFWGQISAVLGEQLERYQPKMGTVSGATGAYLMVLPDGSATPRKMAHLAGRRFRVGDRVAFGPIKGQPVVYGGVLTATGVAGEGVVSMADIDQQFANTLTSFQSTLTNHETRITTAQSAADAAASAAAAARTRADTAFTNAASAQSTASTAQTTANNAQTAAGNADAHAQNVYNLLAQGSSDGTQAINRIQTNLNQRMDAACLAACGRANCNNPTFNSRCTAAV